MKNILGRLKRKSVVANDINDNKNNNQYNNVDAENRNKINPLEDNYNSNTNFLTKNDDNNFKYENNLNRNQIDVVDQPKDLPNTNNLIEIKELDENIINKEINSNTPEDNINQQEQKIENKIQTQFKNIFQGKDLFSNNKHRQRLMYITFGSVIIDALILEILCLYLNICYGEQIEMQKWISNSIVPVCIILSIFYIILYFGSDLISKEIISMMNILIMLLTISIVALGVFTIFKAISVTMTDIEASWQTLSKQSKIYYYNNSVETLYTVYRTKMIVTGVCFIILALTSVANICFSFLFLDKLNITWRPPLIARLSDERALRYINYYNAFNQEVKEKNLIFDKEEDKLLPENQGRQVENILNVDAQELSKGVNFGQLQNENKEFTELDVNNEKKENKSYLNNLRRKNKDSNV